MNDDRTILQRPGWAWLLALMSVGFTGACFGFFFAWQSSTLRGLDLIDAATAIKAMQAMNASVRNPLFGAVYFGTPVALAVATAVAALRGTKTAMLLLGLALVVHIIGVFGVTAAINVPLNLGLAAVDPHAPGNDATWQTYSQRWQSANLMRMLAAGGSLMLAAMALSRTVHNRKSQ